MAIRISWEYLKCRQMLVGNYLRGELCSPWVFNGILIQPESIEGHSLKVHARFLFDLIYAGIFVQHFMTV